MSDQTPETSAAAGPLAMFNFASPDNPYALFSQLRERGAVVQVAPGSTAGASATWVVTQLEEAVQVFKDRRFTVEAAAINPDAGMYGESRQGGAEELSFFGAKSLTTVDGADHARLRGLVSQTFTPRYIESLRPNIQQIADELLDQAQARGTMDLVHDFGYPLPINVISDMLGVPKHERERLMHASQTLTSGIMDPSDQGPGKLREFAAHIVELVADKRQHPGDDLISQLIDTHAAGDRLDQQELLAMIGLLIFAGHETTANLISTGMLMLLDHPEQLARLRADLSLVPAAVEELLRLNGPVLIPSPRFALEDLTLSGQQLRRGDAVIVAIGAANHDPTAFSDPEELDIARTLSRHVAFGQGVHFCLGAPLARLEGEIAFTTLLRRLPDLRLNAPRASLSWRGSVSMRGLTTLPVAF
jgi:cytochrome P450